MGQTPAPDVLPGWPTTGRVTGPLAKGQGQYQYLFDGKVRVRRCTPGQSVKSLQKSLHEAAWRANVTIRTMMTPEGDGVVVQQTPRKRLTYLGVKARPRKRTRKKAAQ